MKFFSMIQGEKVHLAPGKKVIPSEEYSKLVEANELLEKVHLEIADFRKQAAQEAEKLKEDFSQKGFEEGLKKWNLQIQLLEKEIANVRSETQKSLVPLAMAAVKKIIGREIELKPETTLEMISTALKAVSHHKKITLYVNKNDLEIVEQNRPRLKALFDHLQSLTITTRDDIEPEGCIIETESGIVNVGLTNQLAALESAFQSFLGQHEKKEGE